jgi:hypothetical protein
MRHLGANLTNDSQQNFAKHKLRVSIDSLIQMSTSTLQIYHEAKLRQDFHLLIEK